MSAFWPKEAERDPATKYIDLQLILFWRLEKNKGISVNDKVDKLYNYMSEQFYDDLTYERLVHRSPSTRYQEYHTKACVIIKRKDTSYTKNRVGGIFGYFDEWFQIYLISTFIYNREILYFQT